MKRILSLSIAALFLSSAAFAKPISANFGHGFPQGSIHHEAATEFAEEVKELSNGAIDIHVFHSGQLGSAREMFEGLQLGSLEMTWVPTARISGGGVYDRCRHVRVSRGGPTWSARYCH